MLSSHKCSPALFWLNDDYPLHAESFPEVELLVAEIMDELRAALELMNEVWR